MKILKISQIDLFEIFQNDGLKSMTMHVIPNLFRSISYRFWDKHFLH